MVAKGTKSNFYLQAKESEETVHERLSIISVNASDRLAGFLGNVLAPSPISPAPRGKWVRGSGSYATGLKVRSSMARQLGGS